MSAAKADAAGRDGGLDARGLTVRVGGKYVCRDLDLAFGPGECWAVLGRNGAGKTTLLHTLAGLRPPAAGRVSLEGAGLDTLSRRHIARRLGLLPQGHHDPFPARVLETALAGRHPHLAPWQWEGPEDIALARQALAQVDLEGLDIRMVDSLSGGERRRLGLATVLTQDPAVALLDEPVNHLDLHHQVALLGLLRRSARERGRTVIMALHDLNLAARYCDHVLMLFGGGEVLQGRSAVVMTDMNLERLLGHPIGHVQSAAGTLYFAM